MHQDGPNLNVELNYRYDYLFISLHEVTRKKKLDQIKYPWDYHEGQGVVELR